MSIKDNISKEQASYNTCEKNKIFSIYENYMIATRVSDIWQIGNSLHLEVTFNNVQKAYLVFTVYEGNIINIKFHQKSWPSRAYDETFKGLKISDMSYAVNQNDVEISLANNEKLIIEKNKFKINLVDKNGVVKTSTSTRQGWDYLDGFCSPPLGFKYKGSEIKPFASLQLSSDELIYGLGEKFSNFVKNGTESVIYNVDNEAVSNGDLAYAGVPLIYSNKNWGLLLNTGHKTEWEIGSHISESVSFISNEECLDIILFSGESIKELITTYTKITGRITGVPDEAYGIWVNRLYYHNKNELFTEIDNSIKNNYPIDVFSLDPKWMKDRYTKTCNFQFNNEQFGDLNQLLSEVHAKGFKMCFWINPYLQIDNSDTWKEARDNKFYIQKNDGSPAHIWSGIGNYQEGATAVDLSNPKAVKWWKSKIINLLKSGVDFIKTDYGDSIDENAIMANGELGANFRNTYCNLYLKYAYEATQEVFGKDKGFVLSRPGYIGTQKYVGKWGGDSASTFNELKMQLRAGLSNALCGTVMWGTDIGGFLNLGLNETDLYARWTQFGMFNPFSRYHGVGPREPWYFGDKDLQISKKFAKIKRQLLPYYKMYEQISIETGLPIIRPLVIEYQNDVIASKIEDQFLLGEEIMIAPILVNNARARQVYFPKGQWINFFTNEVFEGQMLYTIKCEIDEALVFVKSGSVIPIMENPMFKFNNLDSESIRILKFGKILNNKNLEFKLNDKLFKIIVDDGKITSENNRVKL